MSSEINQRPKGRPHRPTGKPRGGARPGAGRESRPNALPLGSARALIAAQCAKRRFGAQAEGVDGDVGLKTLEVVMGRVADVLLGKVDYRTGPSVLKAAAMAADALSGKQVERQEVEQKVTLASLIDESYAIEAEEKKAPVVPVPPIVRKKAKPIEPEPEPEGEE